MGFECKYSKRIVRSPLSWRGQGYRGQGGGQLDVGADRDARDGEHARVLVQFMIGLVLRQTSLH